MRPLPLPLATRRQALTATLLVVAAACGREAVSDAVGVGATEATAAPMVTGDAVAARGTAGFALEKRVMVPAAAPAPALPDSAPGAMLIRRGDVSVRVDSLEPAMAALRQLAARVGGAVGNVSIAAGDLTVRSATLELRVPAARFDDVMGGLAPIGRVEQSSVSAQDVGEEYVDVQARMANGRRLEQRLTELLATRTGKLEDVLAVERELARVREEIERQEARLRWLGAHVAVSTIAVTVSEPAPVVGDHPGESVLGQAFVRAWRNFVGLVASLIASLGVVVPVGAALAVAARWWRGRAPRPSVGA